LIKMTFTPAAAFWGDRGAWHIETVRTETVHGRANGGTAVRAILDGNGGAGCSSADRGSLVGVILIQKSEGGGLGIGGGGGLGGMMTARSTANLLTRTTAILAGCFMLTSVVLAVMAGKHNAPVSLIDTVPASQSEVPAAPASTPAAPSSTPAVPVPAEKPAAPVQPVAPEKPAAPVAQ
jgi:preprotein translocase subunit SecG